MAQLLNTLNTAVSWRLVQKGSRVFGLLGKATSAGIASFGREDLRRSWAVTAEFGCVRLERLTGEEEITGLELFLPTPFSYDYGITGINGPPELVRAVFGLLPSELEELVNFLRRGSFPVLGFSASPQKCSISCCTIPACWPHLITSNLPFYGNVVSLETFVRIVVSSLPRGHMRLRSPGLQSVVREMMRLIVVQRRGIPYSTQMPDLALDGATMTK